MSRCCGSRHNFREGGEVNTGSNVGDGQGVFAQKLGVDLQFKSLIEGSNIDLYSTSEEITIGLSNNITVNSLISSGNVQAFGGAGGNLVLGTANTWNGTPFPTIYGTSTDQYFMMHRPHIPYLLSGINGYGGGNYGSLLRYASDQFQTHQWTSGINEQFGIDKYVIDRDNVSFVSISSNGNVGIGTALTTATQKLEVIGTNSSPAASGSIANGAFRVLATGVTSTVLDSGVDGSNNFSWLQSRNSTDYSVNRQLRLNPNGGGVNIGYTTSSIDPTVTDIPLGMYRMWHNTTSGETRHYANVGGVLKSSLLT